MLDAKSRGRRLEAALGFGGLKVKEALELLGMSESTYRRTARGTRNLTPHEASQLAERVDLPVEFFDMDFWAAAEQPDGDAISRLLGELEALRSELKNTRQDLEIQIQAVAVEARQRSEADARARRGRRRPGQQP